MGFTTKDIKELRDKTGAGILDCKKALRESGGDIDGAVKILREKGAAVAGKKSGRVTAEGAVGEYLHFNKKVGVLVEVNCETDFVARNEKFLAFTHALAMHVAASAPRWVSAEDVPAEIIEQEREIYRKQLEQEGKPAHIVDKIIDGKLKKFYEANCLLDQPYIEDDSITVAQAVQDMVHATGENIRVARFVRFQVGAGEE